MLCQPTFVAEKSANFTEVARKIQAFDEKMCLAALYTTIIV